MGLPHLLAGPPLLLPLSRLPTPHQSQAFRILAVALVPTARLVAATAPLAETNTGPQATATSRVRTLGSMLVMSQGRCLLPTGPPERLSESLSGTFLLSSSPLDERPTSQCTHTARQNTSFHENSAKHAIHATVITGRPPQRGGRKPGRRRCRCFLPGEGDRRGKETHQAREVDDEVDCCPLPSCYCAHRTRRSQVIGLFVGIDMVFNGWSLVMLALAAKKLPEPVSQP